MIQVNSYCFTILFQFSNGSLIKKEDEERLSEVMNYIDLVMRETYNIQRPREMSPSPDAIKHLAVVEDIQLTVNQAEGILQGMLRKHGLIRRKRVFPDDWAKWDMPIKYVFDGTHSNYFDFSYFSSFISNL